MNTKQFSEAMGEIGGEYVEKALRCRLKQKKHEWVKWIALAACLCLLVAGAAFLRQISLRMADGETVGAAGIGGMDAGSSEGMAGSYSVAVYPKTESEENVASAEVVALTEKEALSHSLAAHLPRELPGSFHYGRGSLYGTVMKNGTPYEMLRIEYISGEIPEQVVTEDGGVAVPDPGTIGDVFVICVMNYEPKTDGAFCSSAEEVTLPQLEENRRACIRFEDAYVLVFTDTAEPAAVLEALRSIA